MCKCNGRGEAVNKTRWSKHRKRCSQMKRHGKNQNAIRKSPKEKEKEKKRKGNPNEFRIVKPFPKKKQLNKVGM